MTHELTFVFKRKFSLLAAMMAKIIRGTYSRKFLTTKKATGKFGASIRLQVSGHNSIVDSVNDS